MPEFELDSKLTSIFDLCSCAVLHPAGPAGDFTVPIIVYGTVIMIMAIMARIREGNTSQDSYQFALLGSLLFVVSDSILAYNSFSSTDSICGNLHHVDVLCRTTIAGRGYFEACRVKQI